MKSHSFLKWLLISGLCLWAVVSLGAVEKAPVAKRNSQSVFLMPKTPAEGRDPFSPASLRPFSKNPSAPVPTVAAETKNAVPVDLFLRGFSGPAARRLAIINNHTFEQGEEAEVIASNIRLKIRCIEMKTNSVVVKVGSELRELRLKSSL